METGKLWYYGANKSCEYSFNLNLKIIFYLLKILIYMICFNNRYRVLQDEVDQNKNYTIDENTDVKAIILVRVVFQNRILGIDVTTAKVKQEA